MVMYIFRGFDDRRAARRALDFWYRRMRDQMSLMDFLGYCRRGSGKDASGEAICYIVYRGPAPSAHQEPFVRTRKDVTKTKK